MPFHRLKKWKSILTDGGVTIDAEARGYIDLVEKDANELEKNSAREAGDAYAFGRKENEAQGSGHRGAQGGGQTTDGGRRQRERRGLNTDYWHG